MYRWSNTPSPHLALAFNVYEHDVSSSKASQPLSRLTTLHDLQLCALAHKCLDTVSLFDSNTYSHYPKQHVVGLVGHLTLCAYALCVDTTDVLYSHVENFEGIPVDNQCLRVATKPLQRGVLLSKFGIAHESTIDIAMRLPAGSPGDITLSVIVDNSVFSLDVTVSLNGMYQLLFYVFVSHSCTHCTPCSWILYAESFRCIATVMYYS